nr:unnamed protein product [Digitaria exilis]
MAAARLRSAAARLRPGLAAARGERRPLGTAAAEAVTADTGAVAAGVLARWELMGARDYYDYRRAIYGDITHKAILVDAAGTLLAPTEPMAQVYRTIGQKYGVEYSENEILMRYRRAYAQPWGRSRLSINVSEYLQALKCDHWFDAVAISAEVAAEKPNPTIFLKACELLGVKPEEAVHIGDDRRNDIWGARDAGCDAWLWGSDVHSFKEVAERIGVEV